MSDNLAERTASNAAFLFAAQILTGLLSLIIYVLLPRYYGAEGIGTYYLAASIWSIAALLIGFGNDVVISREVARDHSRLNSLVSGGLLLRILFHFLGFTAVAIFANIAGYAPETVQVIYVFGLANLIFQIGHMFSAALYGLEKIKVFAVAGIITESVTAIGVVVCIATGQSIVAAAFLSVLAAVARAIFLFWMLRRQVTLKLQMDWSVVPFLLREGASILFNRILRDLYAQADVIIISLFVNETVVGWYSVADVGYGTLMMIPSIISTTLFPTLARLYKHDRGRLATVVRRALNLVLLGAVPMGLGIFIVAEPLILLIVGDEFLNSIPVLAGFGLVAIFTSVNVFLANMLIAMDRQNKLSVMLILVIVLTLPMDFYLIPYTQNRWGNGALGGVVSYLITEIVMMIGIFWATPKGLFSRQNANYAVRVLLAGGVMFLTTWPFRHLFFLVPVLIGAVTYLAIAFLLRLISRDDINLARSVGQKYWFRLRKLVSTVSTGRM